MNINLSFTQGLKITKISLCCFQKAYRQYESAMGSAAGMGDRLCQMEAMDGAARCLEALRLQQKICNCRPLEFNTRLLEVASSIGAKVSRVSCGWVSTLTSISGRWGYSCFRKFWSRSCLLLCRFTSQLQSTENPYFYLKIFCVVNSNLQRYC